MIQSYNELGYHAYNVSSHDFPGGFERVRELANSANFPFISANILDSASQEPLFKPYIIKKDNSGFEADIVREIFALEGYEMKLVYQPLLRTKASFKESTVDGVMTVKTDYPEIKGAYVSEEYITYHNYVISLKSKK